jgi:threonine/homoserine/homoserine lactone efflux protein
MAFDFFGALFLFAFVSTVTPGPNNLMLMASGANFGFQRTIPHMLGIATGVAFMILLVGAGLIQIFDAVSWSYDVLKISCVGYMGFLALKILRSAPQESQVESSSKPFSAMQAVLFQWVNPKAWSMVLSAITLYSPDREMANVLLIAGAFATVNLPAISLWVVLGKEFKRFLSSPQRLQFFNTSMALLLLGSLYPILEI